MVSPLYSGSQSPGTRGHLWPSLYPPQCVEHMGCVRDCPFQNLKAHLLEVTPSLCRMFLTFSYICITCQSRLLSPRAYEAEVHLEIKHPWIKKQSVREEEIKNAYRSIHRENRKEKDYETPSGFYQEKWSLGPIPNCTSPYCLMQNQYSSNNHSQPHCTISSSAFSQGMFDEFSQYS